MPWVVKAGERRGMTPEEFRKYGHAVVDWIADYRARVDERPVMSQAEPGQVKASLPPHPPEDPEPFDAMLRDLDAVVTPGISHWQHPRFFGYFPCNGSLAQRAGRLREHRPRRARPGLAVEPGAHRTGGGRHRLAAADGRACRRRWDGVIQDTASTSTLAGAALRARAHAPSYGLARGGLQAEPKPLVVYTSAHAHSSVEKAALLAGFGRENIRHVPCDARYAMRADALAAAIAERSRRPDACRAPWWPPPARRRPRRSTRWPRSRGSLAGTGIWLHVDAAMAGSAMVLPECRWMWDGVEARRLAGAEPAQVARRGLRLLGVLRARRRSTWCA